jgi:putative DNA methylase
MNEAKRLIEVDFPLEQVSFDSVHEKNVRHGHISTLHIWPARRPLAACRAALIATLLPDPGNAEERKAIYRRLAGEVVETIERKKVNGKIVEQRKRETRGGILHWGRENGPDLDWFHQKIREAYGGRAPKVLDPFAGGGAIPLEAMRLGCEATAIDINPVAWFILKCTLEYPQKLAGRGRRGRRAGGKSRRPGQQGQTEAVEPAARSHAGAGGDGRAAGAADRSGPPADASVESGRPDQGR